MEVRFSRFKRSSDGDLLERAVVFGIPQGSGELREVFLVKIRRRICTLLI
jgi:hypothetical protein